MVTNININYGEKKSHKKCFITFKSLQKNPQLNILIILMNIHEEIASSHLLILDLHRKVLQQV